MKKSKPKTKETETEQEEKYTKEQIEQFKTQRDLFNNGPYTERSVYAEPNINIKATELNLLYSIWAELNLLRQQISQPQTQPQAEEPQQEPEKENTKIY